MHWYRDLLDGSAEPPAWLRDVPLREGEVVLGIYENCPAAIDEAIVVTDLSLHLRRGTGWEFISYLEIESVQVPMTSLGDKYTVSELVLRFAGGRVVVLPVRGGRVPPGEDIARFRDAWVFSRFLGRTSGLLREQKELVP